MNHIDIKSAFLEPQSSPIEFQLNAYQYWLDKRGDRFASGWDEIELMDFPPDVIPSIAVADVDPDTFEVKYRFWGTLLTQLHSADLTGKSASALTPPALGGFTENAYIKLCKEQKPPLDVKEYFNKQELRGREMVLRMPLSNDGRRVTNSLAVIYHETIDPARPHDGFFEHILRQ